MRQYAEQKRRVGDAVLLFRMGDFYETFWDDAILCSKVLGIALTARNKGENPIPLAGIPYHALESYLKKLVAAGYKVAISEQLEDPKQAKGVVQRDVVRIVTAGTLTDDALLADREANTLAALCLRRDEVGLAIAELSSGRFEVLEVARDQLLDELARCHPAELLVDDERGTEAESVAEHLRQLSGTVVTRRPAHELNAHQAEGSLLQHFGVSTLAGFGLENAGAGVCAAGAIIQYLRETQRAALSHLTALRRRTTDESVHLDHATWRALEIECVLRSGSREGSLFHTVDRTVHPLGGRTLLHWLRRPLRDAAEIVARQDAVDFLAQRDLVRRRLRERFRGLADIERITARVALRRASPRDLASLGRVLQALPAVAGLLSEQPPAFVAEALADLSGLEDVATLLAGAIREDAPPTTLEGGFIADGFDAELDRLRAISRDGQSWLAEYQRSEMERTGIASLKVGFHRVFGYYLEIPNSAKAQAPSDYVRKQTVKNAERYVTDRLREFEEEVLTARDRAVAREQTLFDEVREQVAARVTALLQVARALGRLDCVAGLAELAIERRYVRPEILADVGLDIRDGRHPVLDRTLGEQFVPNDTCMMEADSRVFVITGPNMAGKSTYIRQVALLTLLAHTGSFVPAAAMRFSITDRIFARVGASDELTRGQSTFMVEMTEAANILHHATPRSLVVLDEIGRGTSTFDGLSLAWAITEHLTGEVGCRTLVATHYHELTELASLLRGVRNYNVVVRESSSDRSGESGIAFLHRIVEGGASKSYGIQVARLAGIPRSVVARSREVLEELERSFARESRTPQLARKKTRDAAQLSLFVDPAEKLLQALAGVDPDRMTPLEALALVKAWKDRFGER